MAETLRPLDHEQFHRVIIEGDAEVRRIGGGSDHRLQLLGIEPGRLAFELVESIFLDKSDDLVLFNIEQIKELGIDIEIDDFGTGHASIVSLLVSI